MRTRFACRAKWLSMPRYGWFLRNVDARETRRRTNQKFQFFRRKLTRAATKIKSNFTGRTFFFLSFVLFRVSVKKMRSGELLQLIYHPVRSGNPLNISWALISTGRDLCVDLLRKLKNFRQIIASEFSFGPTVFNEGVKESFIRDARERPLPLDITFQTEPKTKIVF